MINNNSESLDDTDVDDRDYRALTECMTVLPQDGDVYEVISESGASYCVDTRVARCSCPDHKHRDTHCKHIRRATIASGQRPVPSSIDRDEIDELLGECCDSSPYHSRAGTSSDTDVVADGSGTTPVDPSTPAIPPHSDNNYDDRFASGSQQ